MTYRLLAVISAAAANLSGSELYGKIHEIGNSAIGLLGEELLAEGIGRLLMEQVRRPEDIKLPSGSAFSLLTDLKKSGVFDGIVVNTGLDDVISRQLGSQMNQKLYMLEDMANLKNVTDYASSGATAAKVLSKYLLKPLLTAELQTPNNLTETAASHLIYKMYLARALENRTSTHVFSGVGTEPEDAEVLNSFDAVLAFLFPHKEFEQILLKMKSQRRLSSANSDIKRLRSETGYYQKDMDLWTRLLSAPSMYNILRSLAAVDLKIPQNVWEAVWSTPAYITEPLDMRSIFLPSMKALALINMMSSLPHNGIDAPAGEFIELDHSEPASLWHAFGRNKWYSPLELEANSAHQENALDYIHYSISELFEDELEAPTSLVTKTFTSTPFQTSTAQITSATGNYPAECSATPDDMIDCIFKKFIKQHQMGGTAVRVPVSSGFEHCYDTPTSFLNCMFDTMRNDLPAVRPSSGAAQSRSYGLECYTSLWAFLQCESNALNDGGVPHTNGTSKSLAVSTHSYGLECYASVWAFLQCLADSLHNKPHSSGANSFSAMPNVNEAFHLDVSCYESPTAFLDCMKTSVKDFSNRQPQQLNRLREAFDSGMQKLEVVDVKSLEAVKSSWHSRCFESMDDLYNCFLDDALSYKLDEQAPHRLLASSDLSAECYSTYPKYAACIFERLNSGATATNRIAVPLNCYESLSTFLGCWMGEVRRDRERTVSDWIIPSAPARKLSVKVWGFAPDAIQSPNAPYLDFVSVAWYWQLINSNGDLSMKAIALDPELESAIGRPGDVKQLREEVLRSATDVDWSDPTAASDLLVSKVIKPSLQSLESIGELSDSWDFMHSFSGMLTRLMHYDVANGKVKVNEIPDFYKSDTIIRLLNAKHGLSIPEGIRMPSYRWKKALKDLKQFSQDASHTKSLVRDWIFTPDESLNLDLNALMDLVHIGNPDSPTETGTPAFANEAQAPAQFDWLLDYYKLLISRYHWEVLTTDLSSFAPISPQSLADIEKSENGYYRVHLKSVPAELQSLFDSANEQVTAAVSEAGTLGSKGVDDTSVGMLRDRLLSSTIPAPFAKATPEILKISAKRFMNMLRPLMRINSLESALDAINRMQTCEDLLHWNGADDKRYPCTTNELDSIPDDRLILWNLQIKPAIAHLKELVVNRDVEEAQEFVDHYVTSPQILPIGRYMWGSIKQALMDELAVSPNLKRSQSGSLIDHLSDNEGYSIEWMNESIKESAARWLSKSVTSAETFTRTSTPATTNMGIGNRLMSWLGVEDVTTRKLGASDGMAGCIGCDVYAHGRNVTGDLFYYRRVISLAAPGIPLNAGLALQAYRKFGLPQATIQAGTNPDHVGLPWCISITSLDWEWLVQYDEKWAGPAPYYLTNPNEMEQIRDKEPFTAISIVSMFRMIDEMQDEKILPIIIPKASPLLHEDTSHEMSGDYKHEGQRCRDTQEYASIRDIRDSVSKVKDKLPYIVIFKSMADHPDTFEADWIALFRSLGVPLRVIESGDTKKETWYDGQGNVLAEAPIGDDPDQLTNNDRSPGEGMGYVWW